MGIATKIVTLAFTLGGVALFSQLPEFAQQYRQRLGGAVDELKLVVTEFDKDAAAAAMTREEALDQLKNADKKFPQERGETMERTIDRFVLLSSQQVRIEEGHVLVRPIHVLATPDGKVIKGAWSIFEPAVPLNLPGAVYGGAGGLLGFLLARLGLGFRGKSRRNKNDEILNDEIQKSHTSNSLLEVETTGLKTKMRAGLLDGDIASTELDTNTMVDVRFAQKVRGEVNEYGFVVRNNTSKLE